MIGLVNKALESFVIGTKGTQTWQRVMVRSGLPVDSFEAMLFYQPDWTETLVNAACAELRKSREEFLQDVGQYLVSNGTGGGLRRLMRFGGARFEDFLFSLEDLRLRARLALSGLDLPPLTVTQNPGGRFVIHVGLGLPGFAEVLVGIVQAIADDYGALVIVDRDGLRDITVFVADMAHSSGNQFTLGAA
jgi:hypothetical protein